MNVEELLQPIAGEKPCGEDFTYHPTFQNLETIARGKPETQFSAAEEPQWKEVRDAAVEVLTQSKHLAASVILTVALLEIDGLEGLRDGLAVVRGLLEKYWNDMYPKLDPEDNNDPTERLNILNNLSSGGEPYRFTTHVRQLVICQSSALGRITLQQLINAKDKAGKPPGEGGVAVGEPDLKQVQATFQDAGPEAAKASLEIVNQVISNAEGIEGFLDTTLGAGRGVNFEALDKLLAEMKSAIEPNAAGEAIPLAADSGQATPDQAGGAAPARGTARGGPGMSGSIQSRADVTKALDLICQYYKEHEPSSPIPLLLQRAQRLVDKDFMEIIGDLNPDAINALQVITGTKPKE